MSSTGYSTENGSVDPIFYPVVPDSFMTRTGRASGEADRSNLGLDWPEEVDRPLVSPHDRWSF